MPHRPSASVVPAPTSSNAPASDSNLREIGTPDAGLRHTFIRECYPPMHNKNKTYGPGFVGVIGVVVNIEAREREGEREREKEKK